MNDHYLEIIKEAVEEKKALEPVILKFKSISKVTDYFLNRSGQSPIQVRSIADNIIDKMNEASFIGPG